MSYDTLDDHDQSTLRRLLKSNVWKNVAYAGIGIVIVAIIAAIVLILVLTYKQPIKKKSYTFESMFDASLNPQSFYGDWSTSNTMVYWVAKSVNTSDVVHPLSRAAKRPLSKVDGLVRNEFDIVEGTTVECSIVSRDPVTNKETVIFKQSLYPDLVGCDAIFTLSPDSKYLVLEQVNTYEKVFRHSKKAKYLVYEIATQKFTDLSSNPANKQRAYLWCPTGSSIGYVEDNNLFIRQVPSGQVAQVTQDGDNEVLFNGVTDWIYEEEVFESVESFVWNADCSKLAWLKLDESKVNVYRYEEYEEDSPYPIPVNIRIPTPNYTNPTPSVHIYDVTSKTTSNIDLGPVNTGNLFDDFYVYDLKWAGLTQLAVVTVPRIQQQKTIWLANAQDTVATIQPAKIRTEISTTWIQYARAVQFISATQYVDLVAFNNTYHIGLFNTGSEQPVKYLTSGDFQVTQIYNAYNEQTKEIYFASTERHSTERHVYAVNVETGAKRALTDDNKEGYYSASFTADGQFYILSYDGPQLPYTLLKSTDETLNITHTLVSNAALKKVLDGYTMPQAQITTIENAVGDQMNTLFIYPPDWTSGTEIQYPVLFYMYNGPGSQLVTKSWVNMHNQFSYYMAAQGFIVVTIDARGTGFKGIDYMTGTYKNLGKLEVEDQLFAAEKVAARADTDGERMAIWGWSYGGYVASKTVSSALNTKAFKLGMSVAPVTDWRYYDSAYTERYMQWPAVNVEGYYNSSVINQIKDEKCPLLPSPVKNVDGVASLEQSAVRFVLVHGTGDDNVHPLNSYNLMTELQQSQVQFETMFYPNKDHSITGGNTRKQLYRFLSNRLKAHLIDLVKE